MPDETATEDLTGLKSALDKERRAREAAERKVKDLTDTQEANTKALMDQVAQLQQQLTEKDTQHETEKAQLLADLQQRDLRAAFTSAYGDVKGLPEYHDLLYTHLSSQLQIADGQITTADGQPLSEAIATLRATMPAMFAPLHDTNGSGAVGNNGSAPTSTVRVVGASVDSTRDIDPTDLISGKAVLG